MRIGVKKMRLVYAEKKNVICSVTKNLCGKFVVRCGGTSGSRSGTTSILKIQENTYNLAKNVNINNMKLIKMTNNILIFTILFSIYLIYSQSFKIPIPNDFLNVNKFKQKHFLPKLKVLHDDNSFSINTNLQSTINEFNELKENTIQRIEKPQKGIF